MSDAKGTGGGKGTATSRPSVAGQPAGYKGSMSGWAGAGPRGAPSSGGGHRQSVTGGSRASFRKSTRASRTNAGDASERLQVIVDGVDRTPKPLMSIKPTALKGGGDDAHTPNSDASEFFMDRMSAAFGKAGWFSNADSGTQTPKSEADYDYEAEKKDRDRKAAEEAAQAAVSGIGDDPLEPVRQGTQLAEALPPPPLTERDLDRSVYVTLQETESIFIVSMPGVTAALDGDEAKGVEEANRRYAQLLYTKQAADKYVDSEAQTLVRLRKSREVQSALLATQATGCQATAWDIADEFRALDEAAADAEDDRTAVAGGVPNISQLATGVARYQTAGAGSSHSKADVRSARATHMMGASMMARPSVYGGGGGPQSGQSMMGGMSYMGGGHSYTSGYVGNLSGNSGALPPGIPTEADPQAPQHDAPADPLHSLRGLMEALTLMDQAINQNNYLPQLLLYRDVRALPGGQGTSSPQRRGGWGSSYGDADGDDSDSGRPQSAAPSDGGRSHAESVRERLSVVQGGVARSLGGGQALSRQASERSVVGGRAMSVRDVGGGGGGLSARASHSVIGVPVGGVGYAASVAESNWPEELLQELADLGDDAPRMESLWEWSCPLTAGKHVACMGWNKLNPDLLAVGYGNHSFAANADEKASAASAAPPAVGGSAGGGSAAAGSATPPAGQHAPRGLVAFWSLKNPQFPLWWFEVKSAVTALAFSSYSPNMLALGLYDGTVAIYDIKTRQGTPALESDVHSGKHADPVWKVRWLDRGPERDEPLVSISTDGRVTQWSIAKGLEFGDLMKLKRMARRGAGTVTSGGKGGSAAASGAAAAPEAQDAFISRLTSGMAFDFSARDERIYVAATEDGWLHKCSTSYPEQYLESYRGHMGPVYQVQFSPYKQDMFLSASGDWTLRMWQEGRDTPLLTFQASSTEINDAQWCPANATVFGCVTSSGRLEIWDFALSTVKPVMHTKCGGVKLSCLLFSPTCPVVVCGGEDGSVKAYRLLNVAREYETPQEQLERLDEVIRANVMKQNTTF